MAFPRVRINDYVPNTATIINASTVVGVTGTYTVAGRKTMMVDIVGTAVTPTVVFKGAGITGTPFNLMGTNMSNMATAISAVTAPQSWQFNVAGLTTFKVVATPTSPVSSANVSIYSKAVP
jgi:hypothetical protein